MSDLLEEVDEMMRQERMVALWHKHGKTFVGIIVAIIVATALVSGYKSWNENTRQNDTTQLITLLENPDFPANINEDTLDMRSNLKGMALLSGAGALVNEGKTQQAGALFGQAANDSAIPDEIRDLAAISAVRLNAGQKDVQKQLKSVWNNNKSPWRFHAHLEAAALFAQDQNFTKAREHLKHILEAPNLPQSLYDKAQSLDKIYALKNKTAKQKDDASKS